VCLFSDGSIGNGQHFSYPRSSAYNPSGRCVYIGDNHVIRRDDLATGNRTIISGDGTGTGPQLNTLYEMALDETNQQLYALSLNALYRIDLTTGNRIYIAGYNDGKIPAFTKTSDMAIDLASQTAWLIDYDQEEVIQVNLVTGDRFVLSDNISQGTGQVFNYPFSIVLDTVNSRLLVGEGDGTRIVAVDMANGNRSVLSDASNAGPTMQSIRVLGMDASRNRALVSTNGGSTNLPSLLAVDLSSGDRTMISEPGNIGTGPMFRDNQTMAVDSDNQRVFIMESGDGTAALMNIDMQSGDRVIVSQ